MSVGFAVDTDDDGTGTTGTIHNAAWKAAMATAIDALVGNWTAVTFAAGNFTGNGAMTWTVASGDVILNRYQKINKTLLWQLVIDTSSVGGTPNTTLQVAIPSGSGTFASTASVCRLAYANDNGTVREAMARVVSGTVLGFTLQAGGNWAASTNATYLYLQGSFELA